MSYAWIEAHRDLYAVTMMCELLGVSRSGLRAAGVRSASARARTDVHLIDEIRRRQRKHRGRYGRRRMCRESAVLERRPRVGAATVAEGI
ncbi:MAG: hypothetical protein ABW318_06450 [Vicinamibacterales bacterium]